MNLIVCISDYRAKSFPDVLMLAKLPPTFTVEGHGQYGTCVAIFADLPQCLDLTVRLIGEVINITVFASASTAGG